MICGTVAGGAGAGAARVTSTIKALNNPGLQNATKVVYKGIAGGVAGGATSSLVTLLSNCINVGEINEQALYELLTSEEYNVSGSDFKLIWSFYSENGAVKDGVATLRKRYLERLPENLE